MSVKSVFRFNIIITMIHYYQIKNDHAEPHEEYYNYYQWCYLSFFNRDANFIIRTTFYAL